MKKIIASLLVFFFVQTQSAARAGTFNMDTQFQQLAHDISTSQNNADQIIEKATKAVTEAKAAGVTEKEFLSTLSQKMALNMSAEEIQSSIDELKATHSPEKVRELALSSVHLSTRVWRRSSSRGRKVGLLAASWLIASHGNAATDSRRQAVPGLPPAAELHGPGQQAGRL